ncbi:hypothetical protein [Spirochaeta cellobiosiphila]|uniref:hypothetical protein n=1 Tax=Spirochaeta cellobiosiphila TaxID=504483 RepID=UPI0003F4C282|nr:hypothetical protein [Spirochaeta cellobiosiphila]
MDQYNYFNRSEQQYPYQHNPNEVKQIPVYYFTINVFILILFVIMKLIPFISFIPPEVTDAISKLMPKEIGRIIKGYPNFYEYGYYNIRYIFDTFISAFIFIPPALFLVMRSKLAFPAIISSLILLVSNQSYLIVMDFYYGNLDSDIISYIAIRFPVLIPLVGMLIFTGWSVYLYGKGYYITTTGYDKHAFQFNRQQKRMVIATIIIILPSFVRLLFYRYGAVYEYLYYLPVLYGMMIYVKASIASWRD